jgi:hypothetical protein
MQPVDGSQLSVVHTLLSLQSRPPLPTQTPPAHALVGVQASPSSHGAVLFMWTQPVAGSQVSSVHGFVSAQLMNAPRQLPWEHVSFVVQAL